MATATYIRSSGFPSAFDGTTSRARCSRAATRYIYYIDLLRVIIYLSAVTEFKVVNVVGTIDFQRPIDLDPLAETLARRKEAIRVDYDPSELHLIHSWLFEDEIYVAFYKNGTCSITGANSLDDFYDFSDDVCDIVEQILDFETDPIVAVSNVVATAELDSLPPLDALAVGLGLERTEYEPEQFPALIYRGNETVFLIFANGKLVCTGLTDPERISSAIEDVITEVENLAVS